MIETQRIQGTIAYLPTWLVEFYGKLVGKYTIYMDPMGFTHDWFMTGSSKGLLYSPIWLGTIIPYVKQTTRVFWK